MQTSLTAEDWKSFMEAGEDLLFQAIQAVGQVTQLQAGLKALAGLTKSGVCGGVDAAQACAQTACERLREALLSQIPEPEHDWNHFCYDLSWIDSAAILSAVSDA